MSKNKLKAEPKEFKFTLTEKVRITYISNFNVYATSEKEAKKEAMEVMKMQEEDREDRNGTAFMDRPDKTIKTIQLFYTSDFSTEDAVEREKTTKENTLLEMQTDKDETKILYGHDDSRE